MSGRESWLTSSACEVRLLVQGHGLLPHLENGGTVASLARLAHALETDAGEELESRVVASRRSEATLPEPESSLCYLPAP